MTTATSKKKAEKWQVTSQRGVIGSLSEFSIESEDDLTWLAPFFLKFIEGKRKLFYRSEEGKQSYFRLVEPVCGIELKVIGHSEFHAKYGNPDLQSETIDQTMFERDRERIISYRGDRLYHLSDKDFYRYSMTKMFKTLYSEVIDFAKKNNFIVGFLTGPSHMLVIETHRQTRVAFEL